MRTLPVRHRALTVLVGLVVSILTLGMLGSAPAASASTADPGSPGTSDADQKTSPAEAKDKVRPTLRRQLDDRGAADFWVDFRAGADLSAAAATEDWDQRGAAVAEALRDTAERSQRGVRARLRAAGVEFETFWATNAIKVYDGSSALAQSLAADAGVNALLPSFTVDPPEVTPGQRAQQAAAVEWGIANIKADQVWTQLDDDGEGIVIANIDTGVQYDHPALVRQYRGNNGDGSFTHDYNWFDAAGTCEVGPCDTDGHGTHTMGTMIGDDGLGNQIGVAPGATWIAANGCCPSDTALISSGQWMLEPTDRSGANPDASKRPNIINNSWGSGSPSTQPFMTDISAAWEASGIFASWSNGNIGPQCATAGSPGSLTMNYSVGAYDVTNTIASFSSRGAGENGTVKPNISAPGVNIRSSLPGDTFGSYNGTSMAAPHVAGAVALLWSARPSLVGDTDYTTELLDGTAVDTSDLQCGGTAEDNNVYGEGRLDALALIEQVPAGPVGALTGTATDASTDEPLSGVDVRFVGPIERTVTTQADGAIKVNLPVGTYAVTATAFGYKTLDPGTVEITEDDAVTVDLALTALPRAAVSGNVTDGSDHGWPLYAKIRVDGTPVNTFTDPATGDYSLQLPTGRDYTLTVSSRYPGYGTVQDQLTLTADGADRDHTLPVTNCGRAPGYAADCSASTGGLLVGTVSDALTGAPIVGAEVTRVDAPEESATTVRTPEDPAIGDGFYWMFSTASGATEFKARKGGEYSPGSQDVSVAADATTVADFALGAGRLEVSASALEGTATLGDTVTRDMEVTNTGNAPATFRVVDRDQGFEIATADGGRLVPGSDDVSGAPLRRIDAPVSPLRPTAADTSSATGLAPGSDAWLPIADHPTQVMDNVAGSYQGRLYSFSGTVDGVDGTRASYVYDPQTLQWSELEPMPQGRLKPSGAFYDGKFYVTGGWGSEPGTMVNSTVVYDPETDSWSRGADNPLPKAAAGTAVLDGKVYSVGGCTGACGSVAVMAYDTESDTFTRVADYPEPTAWLSCGALKAKIYCAGGVAESQSRNAYVYDPERNDWRSIASLPKTVWGAGYAAANGELLVSGGVVDSAISNAGWAYAPDQDAWRPLPNSTQVTYRGAAACGFGRIGGSSSHFTPVATAETLPGYDDCGDASPEAGWLIGERGSVTLAAGESTTVTVTMDAGALAQPGTYRAGVHLVEDTPFEVADIPATLKVSAPGTWGRVGGTVSGAACDGSAAPLAGATVGISGSTSTWTLSTSTDGGYARWIDRGENPLDVVAHADGWVPDSTRVRIGKRPVTADLTLDRRAC